MTDNSPRAMASYQAMRRLVLALMVAILAVIFVFGESLQPEAVHERIEAYGIVLIVAGILGRMWSTLYIGGRKSAEVVSTGPYSITRNPLYVFSSLAAMGVGAQMGSYLAALGFGVLCAAAFHIVILREERYLSQRLGQAYADYRARVPRFFPNPFLYREQPTVTFEPRLLRKTLYDGLLFLVSVPFFELIEHSHEAGLIPTLFGLY